jgi:hypothetical protein
MAKQLEAVAFHHKQKYAKLKHECYAKDDVITRLKQDIVDLQDKLSDQTAERVYYQDQLSELTGNIVE